MYIPFHQWEYHASVRISPWPGVVTVKGPGYREGLVWQQSELDWERH